jgi:PhzF family phenazine biosynthesis protein
MKKPHRYAVVDVFSSRPLTGNPVAVVFDADGLDTEAMQTIARWTNLSETTFVLAATDPAADYRLRIFTPRSELPFAGHPTLGSAHAILEANRATPRGGRLVQQCGIGLVNVAVESDAGERRLSFGLSSAQVDPLPASDVAELEGILGVTLNLDVAPAIVNVGAVWVILPMPDAAAVLDLKPDFARLASFERRLGVTGITVFGRHSHGDAAIEVRAFAPSCGVDEDPVCGSGNASVAAFQWARGMLPPKGTSYVATQGRCAGRDGRVSMHVDEVGHVRVGGSCVTCVEGSIAL